MTVPLAKQAFTKFADNKRFNIDAIRMPKKEYDPTKDQNDFMNPVMLKYFWQRLRNKSNELTADIEAMKEEGFSPKRQADTIDTAQDAQTMAGNRQRAEALSTLRTLVNGMVDEIETQGPESVYGYSRESGDPIAVARLMAHPWSTKTVEEQHVKERRKGVYASKEMRATAK